MILIYLKIRYWRFYRKLIYYKNNFIHNKVLTPKYETLIINEVSRSVEFRLYRSTGVSYVMNFLAEISNYGSVFNMACATDFEIARNITYRSLRSRNGEKMYDNPLRGFHFCYYFGLPASCLRWLSNFSKCDNLRYRVRARTTECSRMCTKFPLR